MLDPLMIVPACLVLFENALNRFPAFVGQGFQNSPIYLFGAFGLGVLGVRLIRLGGWRQVLAVLAAAGVVSALVFDIPRLDRKHLDPFKLTTQEATELGQVRAVTPGSAEVISSFGVVGRFAGRPWVYVVSAPHETVPIRATKVVFVVAPTAGTQPLSSQMMLDLRQYVTGTLHAATLHDGPTVWGYLWQAPPAVRQITLPS
jgi:hypothetical protein